MPLTFPTVFILGAGASEPYAFPTGPQLLRNLLSGLERGDRSQFNGTYLCLRHAGFEANEIDDFRDALAGSGRMSVDAFLEHRIEFLEIGKAALAAELLPCEQHARLFGAAAAQNEHWYQLLFNKLSADFDQWGKNDVTFLTFNYDRSLEYYLTTAIVHAYGKKFAEAHKIVEGFRVLHLYGDLGELTEGSMARWRSNNGEPDAQEVTAAADRIHIMHSASGGDVFSRARHFIDRAKVICFLGFGFHPVNMQRLLQGIDRQSDPMVLTTGYGLLQAEQEAVSAMITKNLPRPIIGDPGHKALHFLRQHFRWW